MKIYEQIKKMTIDELTEFLGDNATLIGNKVKNSQFIGDIYGKHYLLKQWLNGDYNE